MSWKLGKGAEAWCNLASQHKLAFFALETCLAVGFKFLELRMTYSFDTAVTSRSKTLLWGDLRYIFEHLTLCCSSGVAGAGCGAC